MENLACALVQFGPGHKLNKEGREPLHRLVRDILAGREVVVSSQRDVLSGFDIRSFGLESLAEEIKSPRVMFLANHYARCPLGVRGNAIVIIHELKRLLDVEAHPVLGNGLSIVSTLGEMISESTGVVLVGGKHGSSRVIFKALDESKALVFYPEGKDRDGLSQGSFKAGRVIKRAAEMGTSLVTLGIFFQDRTFDLRTGGILDNQEIARLGEGGNQEEEKQLAGQRVVDYVMCNIAGQLPEKLRGYYDGLKC